MVPEFVDRTRGSQWNRALPGRRQNPRQPESEMPILNPQGILRIRRIQEL